MSGENKTARELHTHLKDSGTGPEKLAHLDAFLKRHPDGTAEEGYVTLENADVPVQTLVKAGRFVYGDEFGIKPKGMNTTDEVRELRSQIAQLEGQLRDAAAAKLAAIKEATTLRSRLIELGERVMPARISDDAKAEITGRASAKAALTKIAGIKPAASEDEGEPAEDDDDEEGDGIIDEAPAAPARNKGGRPRKSVAVAQ